MKAGLQKVGKRNAKDERKNQRNNFARKFTNARHKSSVSPERGAENEDQKEHQIDYPARRGKQ